ncbi:piriformospora indica-insensitive protein 2 [Selaginella moellendorffii]|nr:piriformospora indica-insensitive protein 2 [Selaginella moellendorffii]|eukprot:XP_002990693.2 piriformospora indica-insensitive protein 2 [Selaginella moellendorffii]
MGSIVLLERSLLFYLVLALSVSSIRSDGGSSLDYAAVNEDPAMDAEEAKAVFDVLGAINSEIDWRALFPGDNPCTGGPHGVNCDLSDDGKLRVVELNLGWVSDSVNNPPCAANATIHRSILKFSRLRKLFFYQCFFGKPMGIPPEVSQLKSLLHLTFQDNSALTEEIPPQLGNLTSLERLVLTENRLVGSIPTEIGRLVNLKQLVLSHNLLSGSIPASLGGLSKLMILDLSSNDLSGPFPPEVGSLPSLEKMDLSSNRIQGGLVLPSSTSPLRFLDLSYNNLSGGIPGSMAALAGLENLFMRGNPLLGGGVPGFLGNLRGLEMVALSGSGLSGPIPDSIGSLPRLNSLALDGNFLSGGVPASLAGLSALYHLNLSSNRLSGKLPFSRQFFSRLGRNLVVKNNSGLCHVLIDDKRNDALDDLNSFGIAKCEDDGSSLSSSPSVLGWDAASSRQESSSSLLGNHWRFRALVLAMVVVLLELI